MRYAHPTPENMQRAVDKLGETFQEPGDNSGIKSKSTDLERTISHSYH